MGLGDVLGAGGNVTLAAGTVNSSHSLEKAMSVSSPMAEALVDVLADKFPGMNVNVRVFMDLEDRDTLFYTAIFSWSLPDFEHQFMPQDMHMKNMLASPEAGAIVMSQFAHWDLGFPELQGYHATWQKEYTRKEQEREREAAVQMQKIAQIPRNYPPNVGMPPGRYPNPQDIINPGPHWRGDKAREQYNGPDRSVDEHKLGRPKGVQPGLPAAGILLEPSLQVDPTVDPESKAWPFKSRS